MLHLKGEASLHFHPTKKVIKAAEYAAWVDAKAIIALAQEEAFHILEEAKGVYEAEKERGYQVGLEEGKVKISEHMLDAVSSTINYYANNQEDLVELILRALKRILGELKEDEIIVGLVKNALEVAKNQERVTLVVHPKNEALLREKMAEILAKFPGITYLDIATDWRQKTGDCILKTEIGVVNASIDVQLEAIRNSLRRAFE